MTAARSLGAHWELDPFVVGATMVAVGTSIPELATTLIARLRGHDDIALGTVLGSNIFNGLFVVPAAALISPIEITFREVAFALAAGVVTVAMAVPARTGRLGRRRGTALLVVYGLYVVGVIVLGP